MRTPISPIAIAILLGSIVSSVQAQTARWGSPTDPTVKSMIAMEKMWLDSECGPQPALNDVFADEFQGTAPSGARYGKAQAITSGREARDCQLGEVKVQFFGDVMAVAYGSESTGSQSAYGMIAGHWSRQLGSRHLQ